MQYRNNYHQELDDEKISPDGRVDNTSQTDPDGSTGDPNGTQNLEPITPEETTFKKRYGDLRSYSDRTINQLKDRIGSLEVQLTKSASQELALPRSEAEIEVWMQQYPDVGALVMAIARREVMKGRTDLEKELEVIKADKVQAKHEAAFARLLALHPDFKELDANPEFHDWLRVQPMHLQDSLLNNPDDYISASRTIDLYKLEHGIKKPVRSSNGNGTNLDASMTVTRGRSQPDTATGPKGRMWKESEIAGLKGKEFLKYEDEIEKAQLEGRIIRDMSRR